MKSKLLSMALLGLCAALRLGAQEGAVVTPESTKADVARLLLDFLTYNSDPNQHDRFWAEDIVYTSSKGIVQTKPGIMKEVRTAAAEPKSGSGHSAEPQPTYGAEDILVRPYGDLAALTFRLVVHEPDGKTDYYRNSGMFIHRDGRWQAVTWQATKIAAEPNSAK